LRRESSIAGEQAGKEFSGPGNVAEALSTGVCSIGWIAIETPTAGVRGSLERWRRWMWTAVVVEKQQKAPKPGGGVGSASPVWPARVRR